MTIERGQLIDYDVRDTDPSVLNSTVGAGQTVPLLVVTADPDKPDDIYSGFAFLPNGVVEFITVNNAPEPATVAGAPGSDPNSTVQQQAQQLVTQQQQINDLRAQLDAATQANPKHAADVNDTEIGQLTGDISAASTADEPAPALPAAPAPINSAPDGSAGVTQTGPSA